MKKRFAAVLLAAVTACPLLTLPASASIDEKRAWNGRFYTYSYEQQDYAVTLNSSFEFSHPVYTDDTGGFSCKWDRVFNVSAEVGCGMPEGYAGKNYKVFNMLEMIYDVDFCTDGNGYFGVHGWTQNPLVEYYIIEGWGSWRPPGGQGNRGPVTVNGRVYDVYQTMRNNLPSIEGERTFPQYFAVRQENPVTEHVQNRVKGTVDICKVFSEFEKKGFDRSGELYSCGLVVEAYGGGMGDASGYFTVHSASRSWSDRIFFRQGTDWFLTDDPSKPVTTAPVQTEPVVTTTTEPKLPADENGVFFREDFESGRGDWEKRAYKDDTSVLAADTAYYAEGQQSLYVTERSESWNGAALSLEPYALEPGKAYSFQAAVMQNSAPDQTFTMLLEYIDCIGTKKYDLIAQAECRQNTWTVLRDAAFVIPADSTELILAIHTDEGVNDFRIDSVTVAEAGRGTPIDLSGAKPASVSGQTGDANCDGAVDVSDAVLVMRYAVADREAVISEQGLKNADTDKNGNTDSDDATNILLHIAKKIRL